MRARLGLHQASDQEGRSVSSQPRAGYAQLITFSPLPTVSDLAVSCTDFERVLDCILPILSAKINSRTFRNKSIPGAHLLLDSSPSSARLLRAFFYDWSNIKSRRFFVLGFDEVHQVELPGKLHFDLLELATPEDGSLTYVAEVVPGNQKGANALATSLARIAAERIAKGETGHWRAACFLEVMELLKEKRLLESAHIVVKGIYAGTTEDMRKRGNTYEVSLRLS